MSIRVRAFLYTIGIFATVAVGSFATVEILKMIPEAYYFPIAMAAMLAVVFNLVYSVCKSSLEYRAKLQEMVEKK